MPLINSLHVYSTLAFMLSILKERANLVATGRACLSVLSTMVNTLIV